jgi:hypothetical protein
MSIRQSRLRALETARQCATLGARRRTIAYITGLAPEYILRSVYTTGHPAPKGRPRYSDEFYFRAVTRVQAEASLLAARYRRLTGEGFLPADALIAAFRHLHSTCRATGVSFDEAFYLVANLDGIWASSARSLDLALCPVCDHQYVAPRSAAHVHRTDGCPICRADWTSRADAASRSVQRAASPHLIEALPVDKDIARAKLLGMLDALGAGPKVTAVLSDDPRVAMFRAPLHRRTVTTAVLARPLSLSQWSASTHVTDRVQYSVFARWYRRVHELGLPRAEALCFAVARMRTACGRLGKPVRFDRCFEVAALLDGAWGVDAPRLQLHGCVKCGSQHLLSPAEKRPTPCPFCALISRHRTLLHASPAGPTEPEAATPR